MKSFINVQDIGPLDKAMAEAFEIKNDTNALLLGYETMRRRAFTG